MCQPNKHGIYGPYPTFIRYIWPDETHASPRYWVSVKFGGEGSQISHDLVMIWPIPQPDLNHSNLFFTTHLILNAQLFAQLLCAAWWKFGSCLNGGIWVVSFKLCLFLDCVNKSYIRDENNVYFMLHRINEIYETESETWIFDIQCVIDFQQWVKNIQLRTSPRKQVWDKARWSLKW